MESNGKHLFCQEYKAVLRLAAADGQRSAVTDGFFFPAGSYIWIAGVTDLPVEIRTAAGAGPTGKSFTATVVQGT